MFFECVTWFIFGQRTEKLIFMNLTTIHLFNKTNCRAMEGLNVEVLWFYKSKEPVISESFSDNNGQAILSHIHTGRAKVLVDGVDYGVLETPGVHTIIMEG